MSTSGKSKSSSKRSGAKIARGGKAPDRPFAPEILERARAIARQYQVIVQWQEEDHLYLGRGVELPHAYEDGATPGECVEKTRQMFVSVVAWMLEKGQVPPPAASEGKRTEQVNLRFSVEEKLSLEAAARLRGFAGLADYIRAVTIGG
jgi:predicted RNase H-like HicB family nuclease